MDFSRGIIVPTGTRPLEDLADFSLSISGYFEEVFDLLDCLLFRVCTDYRKTGDQFLGLGEGSIGY